MNSLKIATTAAVAAALPVNLLIDFGYTLSSLEVLGITATMAITGAVFGALTARSFLYSYFLALLIYFFAEIYYFNSTPAQSVISLIMLFGLIFLLRRTDTALLPYFLVFAVAFSLSAAFKPQSVVLATTGENPDTAADLDKSILHIVLDEMASPYASNYPPAPGHPAATMLDDLAERGLYIEAQAYAVSARTVSSLSSIVALDSERVDFDAFRPGAAMANRVAENRYLGDLSELGYDVSIMQSNYLDFCYDLENVYCQTYSRIGHVSSLASAAIDERLKFAFGIFSEAMKSNTRTGVMFYYAMTRMIKDTDPVLDFYVPLISYQLMQGEVMDQVEAIGPGQVHFIHLLVPHFPYLYNQDCERLAIDDWGYPDRHTPQPDTAHSYAMYWDQVACVNMTLMKILNITADKDFLTTIVHGDHGARIKWLTESQDREDGLKTFLAIRSPDFEPGVHFEPVSLQEAVINVIEPFVGRNQAID